MNQQENHAKYCSKCRKSLRVIRKLQKGCIGLATSAAILLRKRPIVAIASVFASLWMKNFLRKVATIIEGNNHRSEIGDRSVAAVN